MTEQEICEVEKRAEKATPGPWAIQPGGHCGSAGKTYSTTPQFTDRGNMRKVDADFIAHARGDIPKLCKEVRKLQRENEGLQETLFQAGIEK